MKPVCFSFILNASPLRSMKSDVFENDYQTVYKPLIKFIYKHSNVRMSFFFNGPQFQFLKKKHPEFIKLLQELIAAKRVEILGGGFYDPVFPLLFPMDRTGQVDMLSAEIRSATGKRPRGITICGSCWDLSLVTSFSTCGMEYIVLDESLFQKEKILYVPFFMTDKGKGIDIIPVVNSLKPFYEIKPADYITSTSNKVYSALKKSDIAKNFQSDVIPCVTLQFSHNEIKELLEAKWFDGFSEECEKLNCETVTPYLYKKNCSERIPVFLSAGIDKNVAQWAVESYKAVKLDACNMSTIYDFLQIYPQSRSLYDRMLYVSLLVNQCHGDKIRKRVAREKLWEAQNCDGFICTSKGAFVNSSYRQQSYKYLIEAEKLLRECGKFTESLTSFDYNGDGVKEYVCRMENYFAVVSSKGGAVKEFDVMKSSGNYADNLSRIKEFDGCDDNYERGLFVDHIFTPSEFEHYLENKPCDSGIFSRIKYSELKLSEQHREIQLTVNALFNKKQKIFLRKKYIINSSGMMIQYIIKNESDSLLSAKFAVESSFAQTNFNSNDFNAFNLEIITNGQKHEIDTKVSSKELNANGKVSNVEGFQLTDTDNGVSFTFEPNECCDLSFVPIVFNRPEYITGEIVPAGMTFANTMFWDINLEPNMEMEKTINFSVFSQHKRRKR